MHRHMLAAAVVVVTGALGAGQTPAPTQTAPAPTNARPAFDVVSIKRSDPASRGGRIGQDPGGRWVMQNVVIAALIRSAYKTKVTELVGVPDWVNTDPYDVMAKADGNPTPDEMTPMLQTLLAERFKMVAHYETREQPVYALVVARSDGRPGPGLKRLEIDCDAINAARRENRTLDVPRPSNGSAPCGYSVSGATTSMIRFGGLPLSRLADSLGNSVGRVVIDKTGLTGNFEFTLESTGGPESNAAGDVPSLFTALQEQLGLKLVGDRAPLQAVIVDHIERPTEN